jgi:hypothetical protein
MVAETMGVAPGSCLLVDLKKRDATLIDGLPIGPKKSCVFLLRARWTTSQGKEVATLNEGKVIDI